MDYSRAAKFDLRNGVGTFHAGSERVQRILLSTMAHPPHLSLERARYFTESMRATEGQPLPLRWAKAMVHAMRHMGVWILPDELIVGRGSAQGRYGFFYPELEGAYFNNPETLHLGGVPAFSPEDVAIVKNELAPYWRGRTYHDSVFALLPDDLKTLLYQNNNSYLPSFIVHETATMRHSLQWSLDYKKVLERGFRGIAGEAEQRLSALPGAERSAAAFYEAVIILCEGIRAFAERYAMVAESQAMAEPNPERAQELRAIAVRCRRVPYNPAESFLDALQAQWFTQFTSRLEQVYGGGAVGNGRIDQYLYPLYRKDSATGSLPRHMAVEQLQLLWAHMAQHQCLQPNPTGMKVYQDHDHWEFTTIGGQTPSGEDAGNELTDIILESSESFPLDYPYLGMRIHKGTPDRLLRKVCSALAKGKGTPVLLNDEEIVPLLQAKGGSPEEALDYCGSGYSEARMINAHTYFTGTTWVNMPAVLEMALRDGWFGCRPGVRAGLHTGKAEDFTRFEDLWAAFEKQLRHVVQNVFRQQYYADSIRSRHVAAPLLSALHTLCMRHGMEVNSGAVPGGVSCGGVLSVLGFATLVDSLYAVKHLVFEEKIVSLPELVTAIEHNFEQNEVLRQRCLNANKYGTMHGGPEAIGKRVDALVLSLCLEHKNYYGGIPEVFYIPITRYLAMGRETGATPNGRLAGEPLSIGVTPTRGCCTLGPSMVLHSVMAAKAPELVSRASRSVVLEMAPVALEGEKGVEALMRLIRVWCLQKHWFLHLRLTNRADVVDFRNNAESFYDITPKAVGFNAFPASVAPSHIAEIMAPPEREKQPGHPATEFPGD